MPAGSNQEQQAKASDLASHQPQQDAEQDAQQQRNRKTIESSPSRTAGGEDKEQQDTTYEEHKGTKGDEEDKEECGWCRWMKGGGCREPFEAWQNCIDEMNGTGREVTECAHWMGPLFQCMLDHKDYYEPQLKVFLDSSKDADKDEEGDTSEAAGKAFKHNADERRETVDKV